MNHVVGRNEDVKGCLQVRGRRCSHFHTLSIDRGIERPSASYGRMWDEELNYSLTVAY